jgi:hypothetical protein
MKKEARNVLASHNVETRIWSKRGSAPVWCDTVLVCTSDHLATRWAHRPSTDRTSEILRHLKPVAPAVRKYIQERELVKKIHLVVFVGIFRSCSFFMAHVGKYLLKCFLQWFSQRGGDRSGEETQRHIWPIVPSTQGTHSHVRQSSSL